MSAPAVAIPAISEGELIEMENGLLDKFTVADAPEYYEREREWIRRLIDLARERGGR